MVPIERLYSHSDAPISSKSISDFWPCAGMDIRKDLERQRPIYITYLWPEISMAVIQDWHAHCVPQFITGMSNSDLLQGFMTVVGNWYLY